MMMVVMQAVIQSSFILKISLGNCMQSKFYLFSNRVKLVGALVLVFKIWIDILLRKTRIFWLFTIFQMPRWCFESHQEDKFFLLWNTLPNFTVLSYFFSFIICLSFLSGIKTKSQKLYLLMIFPSLYNCMNIHMCITPVDHHSQSVTMQ